MTKERAIEILNPEHREDYPSIEPVNEARRMGMEALEYRTPKKPENEGIPSEAFIEELKSTYAFNRVSICPNCRYINIKAAAIKCCCNCGQALDWT